MDDPELSPELHRAALKGLGRVNSLSRTVRFLAEKLQLEAIVQKKPNVRILDLACGGGDVTRGIAQILARKYSDGSKQITVEGWDISSTAVNYANQNITDELRGNLCFRTEDALADAFNSEFENSFDVVFCTLFLHHLSEDQAVRLLRRMHSLSNGVVMVDDLRRTRLGLLLAQVGCRLLSRSRIVHTDGPMSVCAAFTESEVNQLARSAGLDEPTIIRHWPERFLATWRKSS